MTLINIESYYMYIYKLYYIFHLEREKKIKKKNKKV